MAITLRALRALEPREAWEYLGSERAEAAHAAHPDYPSAHALRWGADTLCRCEGEYWWWGGQAAAGDVLRAASCDAADRADTWQGAVAVRAAYLGAAEEPEAVGEGEDCECHIWYAIDVAGGWEYGWVSRLDVAPDEGWRGDCEEPHTWPTVAAAEAWVAEAEAGTYRLAHGQYSRPQYRVVSAV